MDEDCCWGTRKYNEETDVGFLIREAQNGDEDAMGRLISLYNNHIYAVTNNCMRKYGSDSSLDNDDCFQHGVIGFIKAVRNYMFADSEYDDRVRLYNYSRLPIHVCARNALLSNLTVANVPVNIGKDRSERSAEAIAFIRNSERMDPHEETMMKNGCVNDRNMRVCDEYDDVEEVMADLVYDAIDDLIENYHDAEYYGTSAISELQAMMLYRKFGLRGEKEMSFPDCEEDIGRRPKSMSKSVLNVQKKLRQHPKIVRAWRIVKEEE